VKLILTPAALKGLRKIPTKDAAVLLALLNQIAADPFGPHNQAKKLTDQPGYRMRHGDWRALYRLDRQADEMVVERVSHRSEVYR
jgi:mRNA interferase RelE/StbE